MCQLGNKNATPSNFAPHRKRQGHEKKGTGTGNRGRWRKTGIKGKTQTIETERIQSQNPSTNSKLSRNKTQKHRSQKQ